MNNASLASRIAAFGLALCVTLAVLMSVAGLAHVEPPQQVAVTGATVGA